MLFNLEENDENREKCTVNTVAKEDEEEVLSESSDRITRLEIRM